MATGERIPLFPLHAVLVPGGHLPLRIFEQRYLDMVRECARNQSGFGVCLLLPDAAGQGHRHHARTGTIARIRDFYTLEDGLLGITAQGAGRFRVLDTVVRDNGLLLGDIAWLEESPDTNVPEHCALLSEIASRFMHKVGANYPDYQEAYLQDAAWLGYRLTELLPLELIEKQVLLELSDPVQRLERLLHSVPGLLPADGA